ncbi:MAG TPA: YceI family protein [Burkholderiaceae bacterium]|nr:YceI family protein [Burkholderiaceae bacterium]
MKKTLIAATLVAAAFAAQAETARYAIDPNHTFVTFEIQHLGMSTIRGRFDKKEGSVELDRAAKAGRAEITIDTTSISTGVPRFDNHLKGDDFFKTDMFPTAKFVADKFVFNGEKLAEVSGTLTMLGKTNPVTLKATNFNCIVHPMLKREACGGDFETTIQRSQWGMNYGLPAVSPDHVRLLVQIEAVKQ